MTLESRSPFALRREIMAARTEDEVVAAAADIPKLFVDLMTAHMDAPSVTRVLTVLHDSLTARFLELTIDRLGEPPVPYAWLAFGSAARSELTLASDQDNGLAYDDTDDPAVADYFRVLAQAVNVGLERCGLPARPARRARPAQAVAHDAARSGRRSSRTASTARTSTAWRAPASPSTTARSPASCTWTRCSPTSCARCPSTRAS